MQTEKSYYVTSFQAFIFEISFENIVTGPRVSLSLITEIPWKQLEKQSLGKQVHMLREEQILKSLTGRML